MATNDRRSFSLLDAFGVLSFVVVVVVSLFVSDRAGLRVFGVVVVVAAFGSLWSGEDAAYGWEGQPPKGHIKGWGAVAFKLAMAVLGLGPILWPDVVLGILGWDK